jgi:hypothetical protein
MDDIHVFENRNVNLWNLYIRNVNLQNPNIQNLNL